MNYTCQYCHNTFSRITILHKHQKTARYCLKLQDKNIKFPKCKYCDKEISRKDHVSRHEKMCPARDKDDQLSEMILDLKEILAERPTSSRNNIMMNIQPITDQEMIDHLNHLTIDFIQEGGKGYANYYPFKDRVLCTDRARKKLRYKDDSGNTVNDGGGVKLTQHFFQIIAPRNEELINSEYTALQKEVEHIAQTGIAATSNLTDILTKAGRLQDLLIQSKQAAVGEENNLTRDFINHLSKIV